MRLLTLLLLIVFLSACSQKEKHSSAENQSIAKAVSYDNQFNEYWYTGKAEVASYDLKQARYGEMRDGHAVLIFVTEPFSKAKQVKLDNPSEAGSDKLTVMKLNFVKKFVTGIYPYSMMLSTFTPVDQYNFSRSLKMTMSSQEWCGHVFTQMNLEKDKYSTNSFSYFEKEGDQQFKLEAVISEDEVWNLIRLDYQALPTGKFQMIPGLYATRLAHKNLKPLSVEAELRKNDTTATYSIHFPNERNLSIEFSTDFPYKILGWEETAIGLNGQKLTTSARLKEILHVDYWNKNSNSDAYLRDTLKIN